MLRDPSYMTIRQLKRAIAVINEVFLRHSMTRSQHMVSAAMQFPVLDNDRQIYMAELESRCPWIHADYPLHAIAEE